MTCSRYVRTESGLPTGEILNPVDVEIHGSYGASQHGFPAPPTFTGTPMALPHLVSSGISMKKYFAFRASILVAASLSVTSLPAAAITINHGPWLTNATDSSMTIAWTTDVNAVSRVYFGETEALGQEAYRSRHGLIAANTHNHSVRLSGLKPGTRYYYKAFSKEIVNFQPYKVEYGGNIETPVLSFTTLDRLKTNFSFVAMSDFHNNSSSHDAQLKAILWPNVDFVTYTGDMTDHFDANDPVGTLRGADQLFKGWLDVAVANYAKQKPMVYLMGNHETRGDMARDMETFFPPASNGEYFYSFNHGPVHFMVMHSGEDKEDCHVEYGCQDGVAYLNAFKAYREQQARWMAQDVQTPEFKNARCKVLMMHIPISSGYAGQEMQRLWKPIMEKNRIDIMLVGHTHSTGYKAAANGMPVELMNSKTSTIRGDVSASGIRFTLTELDGSKLQDFNVCQDAAGLPPKAQAPAALVSIRTGAGKAGFSVPIRGPCSLELFDTRGILVLDRSGTGPGPVAVGAPAPVPVTAWSPKFQA